MSRRGRPGERASPLMSGRPGEWYRVNARPGIRITTAALEPKDGEKLAAALRSQTTYAA